MEWIQKGMNNNIHAPIPVCGEIDNNNYMYLLFGKMCVWVLRVFFSFIKFSFQIKYENGCLNSNE